VKKNGVQPEQPEKTPLELLLATVGPPRTDGSDKFFGMYNVSKAILLSATPCSRDSCSLVIHGESISTMHNPKDNTI